jgi:hypothetical protein
VATRELTGELPGLGQSLLKSGSNPASAIIRWIALFSTDLALTVIQMIEFYGARWKIESGFKELKQVNWGVARFGAKPTKIRIQSRFRNNTPNI